MVTIVFYEEEKANKAYACFIKKINEIEYLEKIKITPIYDLNLALRHAILQGFKENLSPEIIEECEYRFTECFKEQGMSVIS